MRGVPRQALQTTRWAQPPRVFQRAAPQSQEEPQGEAQCIKPQERSVSRATPKKSGNIFIHERQKHGGSECRDKEECFTVAHFPRGLLYPKIPDAPTEHGDKGETDANSD